MDGKGPPLRQVTFRVEHDCPMARLSAEVPGAQFTNWSGHRVEVVEVRATSPVWAATVAAARDHLEVVRSIATPEGGLLVAGLHVDDDASVSRILETHHCLALQPMRVAAGWEHYDAIAYGRHKDPERPALDALTRHWPTQVVRRRNIGPGDLLASLFQSLRPILDAPTQKQAEALVAAAAHGYYESPRHATTADVAQTLDLGRSAFEERLRGGENRILRAVADALQTHRLQS